MAPPNLASSIAEFLATYDVDAKDRIWQAQSGKFRDFWNGVVMGPGSEPISDATCDEVIRILDRNGKGNTQGSEAVAKAMVAQGAWRRMFNELHSNKALGSLVNGILQEEDADRRAALIDELYEANEGQRNNLTGPSGNVVCALLAAYDPFKNLSVISLRDRRALIEFLELPITFDWDSAPVGWRIVATNRVLLEGIRALGLAGSARTVSVFCYSSTMKPMWKGEHTVKRMDKSISVTVPDTEDDEVETRTCAGAGSPEEIRESMQIQALLAKIGASMGFSIWLPRPDRGRVLRVWTPEANELLDELPLGYAPITLKTIELIDVLWLRRRTIVRAFEVEHTTSVYSGLLRMADLVALQPNIDINLHIVAPEAKREKVMQELQRPVFQLMEERPLQEMCSYLSYGSIREIAEAKHLGYLKHQVLEDYEERAG